MRTGTSSHHKTSPASLRVSEHPPSRLFCGHIWASFCSMKPLQHHMWPQKSAQKGRSWNENWLRTALDRAEEVSWLIRCPSSQCPWTSSHVVLLYTGRDLFLDYGMKNLVRATRNSSQHPAHRYLVWMLEDLEAQNSQLEELTIRNANSELPEAVIQLQRVAALVKVPAKKKKTLQDLQ